MRLATTDLYVKNSQLARVTVQVTRYHNRRSRKLPGSEPTMVQLHRDYNT